MAKAYLTPNGWRKTCCTCKQEFTLEHFFKCSRAPDGLARPCKTCSRAATKKVEDRRKEAGLPRLSVETQEKRKESRRQEYARNPEKYRQLSRENRQRNPEAVYASSRASRLRRPGQVRKFAREYYHRRKDVLGPRNREQAMRRYATQGRATPPWADYDQIMGFYKEAARLTEETGVLHQVDHIVPILSKLVCGLHVQQNMQILRKSDNVKKGNRVWPGHPNSKKDRYTIEEAQQGVYLPSKRRDALDAVSF